MRASKMILDNCWLEGDDIIKTDDDLLIPALMAIEELIKFRAAKVVKH
jgi:hypothetical protein